jgi:voltage-gated potassium channel Kch
MAPDTGGPGERPVVVAGFGRMGHRIGHILELADIPYVAIDHDPAVVERERGAGRAVYFGDARLPEVLRAAGAGEAPFVIVATDDPEATERIVASLHLALPHVPVFARARDLSSCRELRARGARFTVSETLEASAELARAALRHAGLDEADISAALQRFRDDYYGGLRT